MDSASIEFKLADLALEGHDVTKNCFELNDLIELYQAKALEFSLLPGSQGVAICCGTLDKTLVWLVT